MQRLSKKQLNDGRNTKNEVKIMRLKIQIRLMKDHCKEKKNGTGLHKILQTIRNQERAVKYLETHKGRYSWTSLQRRFSFNAWR